MLLGFTNKKQTKSDTRTTTALFKHPLGFVETNVKSTICVGNTRRHTDHWRSK